MKSQPILINRRTNTRISRKQAGTAITKELDALVRKAAREFNVSKSWVIATALADFFKIDIPRYDE